jgi:CheY-like chemotaxis protein/Tfp pilus assembly protein PilZ
LDATATASELVYVVDDDALVRASVAEMLRRVGVPCQTFASAEQACASLTVGPMLAFVDLHLPGQGGDAFCQSLRQDDRFWDVPVVMITGMGRQDAVGRCFVAGADDYLLKPLSESQVLSKVTAVRAGQGVVVPRPLLEKRVLVATAHALFGTMIRRLLAKSGYQVSMASSLAEVDLALGAAGAPLSMALLDLEMPQAAALVAKIQGLLPPVPMIAVARSVATAQLPPELAVLAPYDVESEFEHLVRRVNKLLMGSTRSDRRTSPRIPFHSVVEFRLYGGEDWLAGYSFDLSETGVYVRTLTPLPASKPVEVSFRLSPAGEALTARGLVVWSNPFGPRTVFSYPYGMGVTFSDFPVAEWTKVREFIQSQKTPG